VRVRPLLWFLGLVGALALLSVIVGSGRIIHAQVYGSPPLPPIQVSASNPPPSPPPPPPPPARVNPTQPASLPPIQVGGSNPPAAVSPPPQQITTTQTTPPVSVAPPSSALPRAGTGGGSLTLLDVLTNPLAELIGGVGALLAIGIFSAWNARDSRRAYAVRAAGVPVTSAPVRMLPGSAVKLPPLSARFRSLEALRSTARER
jgi:hypothetical protein